MLSLKKSKFNRQSSHVKYFPTKNSDFCVKNNCADVETKSKLAIQRTPQSKEVKEYEWIEGNGEAKRLIAVRSLTVTVTNGPPR